jgi:hypothetical protein
MSETTSTLAQPPTEAAPAAATPPRPAKILMNFIVAFLAPMFLTACGGDIAYARRAAIEAVNAYRAQTQADLIVIAQIVAFGLGALGSLSLAMADDLSLSMTLRLRANANACNRSAEQNRRALKQAHPDTAMTPASPPKPPIDDGFNEAAVIAGVAAAQKRAAEAQARLQNPQPPAAPALTPAPTFAAPASRPAAMADRQWQAMWAAAMADVAAECTAEFPNLPPTQRRAASIRAAALSTCATDLLAGEVPPKISPVPGAMMRPNAA